MWTWALQSGLYDSNFGTGSNTMSGFAGWDGMEDVVRAAKGVFWGGGTFFALMVCPFHHSLYVFHDADRVRVCVLVWIVSRPAARSRSPRACHIRRAKSLRSMRTLKTPSG